MGLSVHSPDELIAAIPHVLGFRPTESIVFSPTRSDLPVAHIVLPTTAHERELAWRSISGAFSRNAHPGTSVAIVCISADREHAPAATHLAFADWLNCNQSMAWCARDQAQQDKPKEHRPNSRRRTLDPPGLGRTPMARRTHPHVLSYYPIYTHY